MGAQERWEMAVGSTWTEHPAPPWEIHGKGSQSLPINTTNIR